MEATGFGIGAGQGEVIMDVLSNTMSQQSFARSQGRRSHFYGEDEEEEVEHPISKADDWKLMPEVKLFHQQREQDEMKPRKLGVTWNNLTVKGVAADAAIHENIFSQLNLPLAIKEARHKEPLKVILDQTHGCVKPGEMLLVLGRPGSGCTTLLKLLANHRAGYAEIEGDVSFGSMNHKEASNYRGQIAMNTEDELFYPTLTVGQTIDFATRMKVPFNLPSNTEKAADFQAQTRDFLLRSMGIDHTFETKVGNEYVRGVSGGERKRVSIIECLATRGSIFCWDNSTRGLDASTALEYTKAVRAMTDVLGLASIVTLYQAGNGIYELFDKVLVLDDGKEIYYGPRDQARLFMENLGFICEDAANTADFLTVVTVPVERRIAPGFEDHFPRTADAIRDEYGRSPIKALMMKESDYPTTLTAIRDTEDFREATRHEQHKSIPAKSPLTTSFATQVKACVIRQYQIIWGDKATFCIKQISTLLQALIAGSLFYNAPHNSSGLFLKGGALFFSLLYHSLVAMSEVIDSFTGRPILAKHKSFALYHPAAFCIAQIAADIPVLIFQVTHFGIVLYFMAGLKVTAGAFFTYWIVVFACIMCITAMFRAIGAAFSTFDAASKVSGFWFTALVLYAGYQIPRPQMHPWFGWIYWINPLAYGLQALLANEFHEQIIPCVGVNLIPSGPSYNDTNFQSCAGIPGAIQGSTILTGDQYLHGIAYSYSHVWRNFGIVWAWWVLFVAITVVSTNRWSSVSGNSNALLIPREQVSHNKVSDDEESQEKRSTPTSKTEPSGSSASEGSATLDHQLVRNTSVFTWKNLTYTVKTPSGDRILLDNVQGWVKPGMLGALMGSSGAGKTTLLDVLAQRKTDGTIHGSIMVDGRPLTVSFQRSAGYCEQLDVHEPMATVREALEFSALLRQPRSVPEKEKLAYVDTIVDLLELHDIEHTLIGRVGYGPGLSIEQKKRLTIGVELVSKPSILIFLDEPTSGLDGQAAFNTIRFLRKLADVGQAVLVTIHQPSASLFAQFDTLLLLARGGKTVYFGEIGEGAATLSAYFAKHGAPFPPTTNPAEHMIDVVSGNIPGADKDWNKVWLESPEHTAAVAELDNIITISAAAPLASNDDGFEFATTLLTQIKIVTHRMNISLYRNTDYVNNKMALHIGLALFTGFSFWQMGNSVADLQLRMFAVFNFIFVAPGVINQLQPLFIERRDIYETREKKSKMYDWKAFVTGLIISEFPYLCVCAVLYFACWYYTCGFPTDSNKSGAVFFIMLMYEFCYTGMGQFIAAYAPNAVFASLVNPLVLGTLISFCGVLVPYSQLQVFWRYWMYYLNPYNYQMGSILTFTVWDVQVKCKESEFAIFDTPSGQSCKSYLADFMSSSIGSRTFLSNPDATSGCKVCQYTQGKDYLATLNLAHYFDGWRDSAINVIFVISSYCLVYLMMKLRTKAAKKAEEGD